MTLLVATMLCCVLIAICAGIDNYFTVLTNLDWKDERNPLAARILKAWGVKALVAGKTTGTAVAIVIIWALSLWSEQAAALVAVGCAVLMAGVAAYLWRWS